MTRTNKHNTNIGKANSLIIHDTSTKMDYYGYRKAGESIGVSRQTLYNWLNGLSPNKSNMILKTKNYDY